MWGKGRRGRVGAASDGLWVCVPKSNGLEDRNSLRSKWVGQSPTASFPFLVFLHLAKVCLEAPSVLRVGVLGNRKSGSGGLGRGRLGRDNIEPLT